MPTLFFRDPPQQQPAAPQNQAKARFLIDCRHQARSYQESGQQAFPAEEEMFMDTSHQKMTFVLFVSPQWEIVSYQLFPFPVLPLTICTLSRFLATLIPLDVCEAAGRQERVTGCMASAVMQT